MQIVNRLERISPSATLAAAEKAGRLRAQGVDVIDLGPGLPDFPTPQHICAAGIRAIQDGHTRYTPTPGMPALRKAIAATYDARTGRETEPGSIVVSSGAKHSLFNAHAPHPR